MNLLFRLHSIPASIDHATKYNIVNDVYITGMCAMRDGWIGGRILGGRGSLRVVLWWLGPPTRALLEMWYETCDFQTAQCVIGLECVWSVWSVISADVLKNCSQSAQLFVDDHSKYFTLFTLKVHYCFHLLSNGSLQLLKPAHKKHLQGNKHGKQ